MKRYRKEKPLPACFVEQDREDLQGLVSHVWQQVGCDILKCDRTGIHISDFVGDTMLHQVHPRWSELRLYPTGEMQVYRDAIMSGLTEQAKKIWIELRGDIAEDVLDAYIKSDNPHHEWAMSVLYIEAKKMADEKGRLR